MKRYSQRNAANNRYMIKHRKMQVRWL